MRKKRLGAAALLAMIALVSVGVDSASAAVSTTAAKFYERVGGIESEVTGARTFLGAAETGTTTVLLSKFGTGTPVEMRSTESECINCAIENKEVTSKLGKVAFGTGKLLFKNVLVTTPAHCKVISESGISGQFATKVLNGHGDLMNGTTAVVQVFPAAGEAASFAAIHLENNGGTCAAAGLYSVSGSAYCNWNWITGSFSRNHSCLISPATQIEDGGGLYVGANKAEITSSLEGSLTSGNEWTIR